MSLFDYIFSENCVIDIIVCMFQRVLTAEYIDGCKVSDVAGIQKLGLSLGDVSTVLYIL